MTVGKGERTISMAKKRIQRMEVLGEFGPEDVLPYITKSKDRRKYEGDNGRIWNVKMWSNRYFTFRESLSCVVCGLTGTVMSLERSMTPYSSYSQPHFNLYAVDGDEQRTLMTKDHIKPKSSGGDDSASNFQTMCAVCNSLKAHHRLDLSQMKLLRSVHDTLDAQDVCPKEVRRIMNGMAGRMASDDGGTPMTAGELAETLLKTPEAVVAIRDSVGRDRVRGVSESDKGITDSGRLLNRFVVIE